MQARDKITKMIETRLHAIQVRPLKSHSFPTLQLLNGSAAHQKEKSSLVLTTCISHVCLQKVKYPPHQQASENKAVKSSTRHGKQPRQKLMMIDLPPEMHHMIVDHLDLIDGTCLGLVNSYFYSLHQRRHGRVHLSTGRPGPNDQEWAWRSSFALPNSKSIITSTTTIAEPQSDGTCTHAPSLSQPQQPFWCDKCRLERCELQRHIRQWFPRGHEYCSVSGKYVNIEGCREKEAFCNRRSPRNPRLCGKHHAKSGTHS
ncbi:hypothetical protein CORC01_01035 [Colletotrichum orchidophilum]|uniref:F-box domain-containing protein n=1 Tax=Colletotrichum orchidophilum TaxID=1209926 RepID=A0A1G4BQZ6_9PEZI|nr:uncharacterized protein CORC01_01035 [Colletotrichum orchidophilum]OHF03716.1 hypothetical protein CORC01_01035 [Colletotrichum orchidophilum]